MNYDTTPMDFGSLQQIQIPVVGPDGKHYQLREASGEASVRYRNALMACTRIDGQGNPVAMKDMANLEPLLVSLCLFDEEGRNVPEKRVRGWPARVQQQLFARAMQISEMAQEGSAELVALKKALEEGLIEIHGQVVSLEDFREAVLGLDGVEYLPLRAPFLHEEQVKNVPAGTPGGSE